MFKVKKKVAMLLSVLLLIGTMPLNVFANKDIYYTNTSENVIGTLVSVENLLNNPVMYEGDGIQAEFNVTSHWWNTIQGDITIWNKSDEPLENWEVEFDFPHEIKTIWNGEVVSFKGGTYIIKNVGWNKDIGVNQNVTIGFSADFDNKNVTIPTNFKFLNKVNDIVKDGYEVNYKTTSDWGSGFNGEISIKNTSTEMIEDWSLVFNFDRKINNIWNGTIISNEDNRYNIKNAGWNSNIAPNQIVTIGFGGTNGSSGDIPYGYELLHLNSLVDEDIDNDTEEVDYTKDSDGDGISDYLEIKLFNTDYNNIDTDGDGLTDYEEVYLTFTNPLKQDTDDNGILDVNEDFDGDGLSSIEEVEAGTDPNNKDTDFDGLTDYEEVYKYGTNPLEYDTDGDKVDDSKEIELGLDPNNSDTNGNGILDGDETFELSFNYEEQFENMEVVPSLNLKLKGEQIGSLSVYRASEEDIYTSKEIPGFIGNAYDFRVMDDIESGVITFKYNPKTRTNNLDELAIYEVDRVNQQMILLENQTIDKVNNTVSAPIDALSYKTYMLLNKVSFDNEFIIEILPSNIDADIDIVFAIDSSGSMSWNDPNDIRKSVTKEFIDILKEDDRVAIVDFDSYATTLVSLTKDRELAKKVVDKIDSRGGTNITDAMYVSINELKKKSSILVRGSLDDEFLKEINKLGTYEEFYNEYKGIEDDENGLDIDGNILVENNNKDFVRIEEVEEVQEVQEVEEVQEVQEKVLELKTEPLKYIVLLTDGESSYYTAYSYLAARENIKVHTVGLGYGINDRILREISDITYGKYYHASDANSLINRFEDMREEIVDRVTDSDGDGLSDYDEKNAIRLFNGVYLGLDPNNPDTDGDGIKDGYEIKPLFNTVRGERNYIKYYKMLSDPTKRDTDGDGLQDNVDPKPLSYTVTGKTLANFAELSYNNFEKYIGKDMMYLLNKDGLIFKGVTDKEYIDTFNSATIIHANNSGTGWFFGDTSDRGLGSVAIRIPSLGENDIIIYGLRGTEPETDPLNDIFTDIVLGTGMADSKQSDIAYYEYKKIQNRYSDIYITGHSLGGRLTLDTLYNIYNKNEGLKKPVYSTTFNGLGYGKRSLDSLDMDTLLYDYITKVTNYYIIGDAVGDHMGDSMYFLRPGKNKGLEHRDGGKHSIEFFTTVEGLIDEFTYESTIKFN